MFLLPQALNKNKVYKHKLNKHFARPYLKCYDHYLSQKNINPYRTNIPLCFKDIAFL